MNYNKKPLNIALTLAFVGMNHTVSAQENENKVALEVIEVTAQKRVQNYPDKQNGARASQSLRPDARATLCDLDGILRERWRVLPLQLFRRAWLRPDCAG